MINQKPNPSNPESRENPSFLEGLVELFSGFENYRSPYAPTVQPPGDMADSLIQNACFKTGLVSATCSLPPGPLGLLTIIPELMMIYRIQGQLVMDIAALHGKEAQVTKELLLYCIFKHGSAQVFRKVIEESSLRILVRPTTVKFFQSLLEKVGLMVTRSILRKQFARWIPVLGAIVTGGFAFMDTKKVGILSKEVFSKEIESN